MWSSSSNPAHDKDEPSVSRWEILTIGLSPLMIFFAWDNNFNMQVMAPIAIILLLGYLVKSRGRFVDVYSFRLCLLIMGSCSVSLLSSLLLSPESVTTSSIARLVYTAMILVWYYVVVNRAYTARDARTILFCNVACGVVISIGVVLRYAGGADGKIAVMNIWGVPVEENYMASLLAFQFILAASFVRYTKALRLKLFSLFCTLAIASGIVFSGSRAALLGAVLALAFMVAFYFAQGDPSKFVFRLFAILVFGGLLLCLVAPLQDFVPSWYFDRFFRNEYLDSSNSQRIEYWVFGLEGLLERPLFGYGVGNYSYYVDHHPSFTASGVVVAHNTYLDALVDVGIVGFSLFAALVIRRFKGSYRHGSFASLLIVALFTSFIVGGERTFFFWNSVAMLSLLAQCFSSSRFRKNEDPASAVFDLGMRMQMSQDETAGDLDYGFEPSREASKRPGGKTSAKRIA